MNSYAFVEGKKIKSAKFYWDWRFSLKNGTKPEKIKKTPNSRIFGAFECNETSTTIRRK